VKYSVRCFQCDPAGQFIADCPNAVDAQVIADRHEHIRTGRHRCVVSPMFETPLEGLL
jgi:hypothetical protein